VSSCDAVVEPGLAPNRMRSDLTRREFLERSCCLGFVRPILSTLQSEVAIKSSSPGFRIVDSHVHIWRTDPKYPWAKETTEPPKKDAPPETLLELMRSNGVSGAILIQVIYYRWDNSYMFDVIRSYPGLFRGVCRVNPESPKSPADLARLSKIPGFAGVRLSPAAGPEGDWIKGPMMEPLWSLTRNLGSTMTVLTSTTRLPDIANLIQDYPDLDVVIDHMADCPLNNRVELQKLLDLAKFPHVYVKISHMWSISKQGPPYLDTHEMVHRIYDKFGPRRLMWGSDWPLVEGYCSYSKALSLVRDELKFLNSEDKEWILGKTIERVWPFA
jgi:predicted TIM-barrel fold metal-dependent hydrolase